MGSLEITSGSPGLSADQRARYPFSDKTFPVYEPLSGFTLQDSATSLPVAAAEQMLLNAAAFFLVQVQKRYYPVTLLKADSTLFASSVRFMPTPVPGYNAGYKMDAMVYKPGGYVRVRYKGLNLQKQFKKIPGQSSFLIC